MPSCVCVCVCVCVCAQSLSYVDSFATPCSVACEAPLSTGFSRQEYQSELPFSSSSFKKKLLWYRGGIAHFGVG